VSAKSPRIKFEQRSWERGDAVWLFRITQDRVRERPQGSGLLPLKGRLEVGTTRKREDFHISLHSAMLIDSYLNMYE
jgi:hypothetical protein